MDKTDLLEWYFAFLRKDAKESAQKVELTPMTLVKADQELLKEKIERDLESASPRSSGSDSTGSIRTGAAGERVRAIKTPPAVIPVQEICLWTCVAVAFAGVFFWFSDPSLVAVIAPILFAVVIVSCVVVLLDKSKRMSKETELFQRKLDNALQETKPDMSSGCSNLGDLAIDAVEMLVEKIDLMKQKEILLFDYCPFLLFEIDKDASIKSHNMSAAKILGYERSLLPGKKVSEFLSDESKERMVVSFERCRRFAKPESIEVSSVGKDGKTVELLWRNEWSESAGSYFCLAEDISLRVENERMKAEMAAMITHDLRAPISGLAFWTDNMLSGCYGELEEEALLSLRRTDRNLRSVLVLLENLLDVNKIESGIMPCNKAKISLQDCFKRTVDLLADYSKDSQVLVEMDKTDLSVKGDCEQIVRIITNFCSNAINWSPAGSTVWIRARAEGSFAFIEVEDSGPGIPAELKDSLFQRWVNPGSSAKRNAPSSGIGLYAARKFAELQGGTVGTKPAENGGSVFWFTLPLAR